MADDSFRYNFWLKGRWGGMGIIEYRYSPTYKALSRKSKDELIRMVLDVLDFCDAKENKRSEYEEALTKVTRYAASCRSCNSNEWMAELVSILNEMAKILCQWGVEFRFDGDVIYRADPYAGGIGKDVDTK